MLNGGNGKARSYFKDHGWHDFNGFHADKYTGRIGASYKAKLERDVAEANSASWSPQKPTLHTNSVAAAMANISLDDTDAPKISLSPKAIKRSEAATTTAPPPKPKQAPSITVAAPVAPDGSSITATRRPTRRTGGLGARRKSAARTKKPTSTAIDWSKVGSDVPSVPVLPKVPKAPQKSRAPVAQPQDSSMSAAQFVDRFKGKKSISSADFAPSNGISDTRDVVSRYGNGTSLSSADLYSSHQNSTTSHYNTRADGGDNIVGMADDILRAATEGVAQAADEVSTAFSDFLNKGYA